MASELNTSIMDLYQLPWYEYYFYMKDVEESKKKKNDNTSLKQEKTEVSRRNVQSIESRNSVNLPDHLKP